MATDFLPEASTRPGTLLTVPTNPRTSWHRRFRTLCQVCLPPGPLADAGAGRLFHRGCWWGPLVFSHARRHVTDWCLEWEVMARRQDAVVHRLQGLIQPADKGGARLWQDQRRDRRHGRVVDRRSRRRRCRRSPGLWPSSSHRLPGPQLRELGEGCEAPGSDPAGIPDLDSLCRRLDSAGPERPRLAARNAGAGPYTYRTWPARRCRSRGSYVARRSVGSD